MPHYDYKCSNCGLTFELFQKMNDEPVSICPNCGGNVKRLIGKGAGPIFKGSGFYQTDYKNQVETKKTDKKEETKKPESAPAKENKKNNPSE